LAKTLVGVGQVLITQLVLEIFGKKTPKRTWLCGWIYPLLFALATRRNSQNTRPV